MRSNKGGKKTPKLRKNFTCQHSTNLSHSCLCHSPFCSTLGLRFNLLKLRVSLKQTIKFLLLTIPLKPNTDRSYFFISSCLIFLEPTGTSILGI